MFSEEFTHYYGSHKHRNDVVTQPIVSTKKNILKFRIDDLLLKQIQNKCKETEKSFSELNRILWLAYFQTEKNILWKKEVEEWK